jgi:hypothetical protein
MIGGFSFVYEIPCGEKFISFVEFNNLEDLGFYKGELRF